MLGVDLVNLSAREQISTAILITGDSDFLPAIEVSKNAGIAIHLYHGGAANPPHNDLYNACDDRTQFSQELIEKSPSWYDPKMVEALSKAGVYQTIV